MNHDDIAETLSSTITELSIDSSLCVQLIDVIRTPAMREQLFKVYALTFRFYRDAIKWYISSTRSKFFGSFNDHIKKGFEETSKTINKTIKRMFYGCSIGTAAMVKMIHRDVASSKEEILRQRQNQWAQGSSNIDPGEFMREIFKAMYQSQAIEKSDFHRTSAQPPKSS